MVGISPAFDGHEGPTSFCEMSHLGIEGMFLELPSRVKQTKAGSLSSCVKFCIGYLGEGTVTQPAT